MSFELRKIEDVGTSNPIVARLSIQTNQILNSFPIEKQKKQEIINVLGNKVQKKLIFCFKIYRYIFEEAQYIKKDISENGLNEQANGRVINVPTIINMEDKCESFLYQFKLALRELTQLFGVFYDKKFDKPRYDKIHEWSKKEFGENDELTKILKSDHDLWINKAISMRNAVEHPGGYSGVLHINKTQIIKNNGEKSLLLPTWNLNDKEKSSILKDMSMFIINMLEFCEDLLMISLKKTDRSDIPFIFEEIPNKDRNEDCQIRIRVSLEKKFLN
ncbi:hypothetical protein [Halanaerobium salsuginis]|jgi:hypothetical protein|uniref:Cthe-2314-like HEPN domain-containing protein n=1 Tax=Halanaerobium salsuginis TaxID=29563 RepID=A0A1I4M8D2_9FIRM|nr:hypothetical protein [Halanaerobium salsuginis]SFL99518.1 hypothetical protein SAMN02983006_02532 [Halanaerobium salsuginis]